VEDAFKYARAADPLAKLYYNDYMIVDPNNAKRDAVYAMAKDFVQRKIPLDGIGFQMHFKSSEPITVEMVDAAIKKFGALGLTVQITELDVECKNGSSEELDK